MRSRGMFKSRRASFSSQTVLGSSQLLFSAPFSLSDDDHDHDLKGNEPAAKGDEQNKSIKLTRTLTYLLMSCGVWGGG